jgi:ribose transport system ATP-binding protein
MRMQENNSVILKIEGINKTFVSTKAVVDVSFEIHKGEVRGLIGENGSGKSTLSSMISGSLQPDSGKMYKNGQEYRPSSMLDARKKGISILVQEVGTINDITVAENIFLGKEDTFSRTGLVNKKKMNEAARKVLADIGASYIKPDETINNVSFEDRKLIEVAMAMYDKPDFLILDETTTALSQKGREKIYSIIENMKNEGKTVLFISHDLQELQQVCDNITVLRDGQLIKTISKEEISIDSMRQLMIGRDLTGHYYREDFEASYEEEIVLKVENVSLGKTLQDISLELYKGEILGIGGLTDCGMHELCKVIFGVTKPDSGSVTLVRQNKIINSAKDAVRNKMGFLPKNREEEGLMPAASIKDNIVLMSLDKLKKGFFITKKSEKSLAKEQSDALRIKMASINQAVVNLSGGNKQKVVIARWLANDSEILIMDCPTRGIDIGVKASIYALMEDLKKAGKSIIMVSEELPELLGMSDRIIILKDGKYSGSFLRSKDLNEEKVIQKII